MIKPISPGKIKNKLPDEVIEAFNKLIQTNMFGNQAIIKQDEVANLIAEYLCISTEEVFKRKLLDVESIYRNAGWKVRYCQPERGEHYYEPYFEFVKE